MLSKRLLGRIALFVGVAAAAGGAYWLATGDVRSAPQVHVAGAEIGFRTWAEAKGAADAMIVGRVIAVPVTYVTYYGVGGAPQYEGDPGVATTVAPVAIDKVPIGDPSLAGATVWVVIPSGTESASVTLAEHQVYLMLVKRGPAPAGVAAGGGPEEVWSAVGPRHGFFSLDSGGRVRPLVDGVFPEIFGPEARTPATIDSLSR